MQEGTTRQQIATVLRDRAAPPSELARELETTPATVVEHVRHLAHSVEHDGEQLLVAPPECEDCGFHRFDDPANLPSRCPECKSEAVTEPMFRIQ